MKTFQSLAIALLAGAMCVSCGSNDPSAATNQSRGKTLAGAADARKAGKSNQAEVRLPEAPITRPPGAAANNASVSAPRSVDDAPRAAAAAAPAPAPADVSDVPPAPKEAQWTLFCATISDPDHVATSRALKESLIKGTGMREWYIVHDSGQSRLYYGYYRSIADKADAAETNRAQADRRKIDALKNTNDERPFSACHFVQLAAPDPESPPQWNIVNAPQDRVWTLMIAGYKDHADRKKAAVETVREARARGEEAYYYHGDIVSNVLIGAWPEDAVIEEKVDSQGKFNKFRDPIFVLPSNARGPKEMRTKGGQNVRVVGMRLVVNDPALQEKIRQYPHLAMNGEEIVYRKGSKTALEPTQVVPIPRAGDSLTQEAPDEPGGQLANDGRGFDRADPLNRPGYQDNSAAQDDAPRPSGKSSKGSGTGRLRSIGD